MCIYYGKINKIDNCELRTEAAESPNLLTHDFRLPIFRREENKPLSCLVFSIWI